MISVSIYQQINNNNESIKNSWGKSIPNPPDEETQYQVLILGFFEIPGLEVSLLLAISSETQQIAHLHAQE